MTRLVFDLGGVVLRWRPDQFLTRLLPDRAPTAIAAQVLAGDFFQAFGGDWSEFDRGRIEPGPLAERIAGRIGVTVAAARRVIDAIPDELQPVPEVTALLARLAEPGRPLHFLSNMPLPYADRLEARDAVLRVFTSGVFSSRVGIVKPEPALFEFAARTFEASPQDLLLIDDLAANVEAARRAGWQALLFEGAEGCEAALREQGIL